MISPYISLYLPISQAASEREAHLAQLGIETRSAAEVREQASTTLKALNEA